MYYKRCTLRFYPKHKTKENVWNRRTGRKKKNETKIYWIMQGSSGTRSIELLYLEVTWCIWTMLCDLNPFIQIDKQIRDAIRQSLIMFCEPILFPKNKIRTLHKISWKTILSLNSSKYPRLILSEIHQEYILNS